MALLSSSCAWLSKYKEDREMSKKNCQRHGIIQPKSNILPNFVKATDLSTNLETKTKTKEIQIESNKENDLIEVMDTSVISSC